MVYLESTKITYNGKGKGAINYGYLWLSRQDQVIRLRVLPS